ncbi:MAG TPA: beta-N-acetylhexosaminidase, partial [Gemmatimonadaceae bacterium]|nr:beta-N-acetylhexosaminidase [Gemmatimonadaceae bacterium]
MSRAVLLLATLSLAACTTAPPPATATRPVITGPQVIPAPASLTMGAGAPFEVTRTTSIVVDGSNPEVTAIAQGLGGLMRKSTGFPLVVSTADTAANKIQLRLADRASLGDEGYELTAAANSLTLVANRPAGLFRGVQTIRQLLPFDLESDMGVSRSVWPIPALSIVDQPRFAWRGAMLDVARHFFTVREVQQFIDLLALYKMNTLHLHLS